MDTDLEVLVDGTESLHPPLPAGRVYGWRQGVAVALVLVAGWLAFPGRSSLIRSEVQQLEGQWLLSQALDAGRASVVQQLNVMATAGDQARVQASLVAVYAEQTSRLRAIRSRMHSYLLVDRGLARLRAAIDRALVLQAADVNAGGHYWAAAQPFGLPPAEQSSATIVAIDRAGTLLTSELHSHGLALRRHLDTAGVAVFHSADQTLALLNHIADSPTRTKLIVDTGGELLLVDIDANRITHAHLSDLPTGFNGTLAFARRSYVVLAARVNARSYVAAPLDLQGPVRPLGNAINVIAAVPAVDPDGLWLQSVDGTARELDGTGHVVSGPVSLPPGAQLQGAIKSGLVLAYPKPDGSPFTLAVQDPASGGPGQLITTRASGVLAAGGNTVVWQEAITGINGIAHLTTLPSGQDRVITTNADITPCGDQWSISSDDTRVASAWCQFNESGQLDYTPGVIDLTSGRLDLASSRPLVTTAAVQPGEVSWASGGDRMFLTYDDVRGAGPEVVSYRVGANVIDYLRLHHAAAFAIAVVPTPAGS